MDLATYKRQTARLDTSDLCFSEFQRNPLDPDALRCLRYMHDVENHTVCYPRDLVLTGAHKDPAVSRARKRRSSSVTSSEARTGAPWH